MDNLLLTQLHAQGYRLTPQRYLILDILRQAERHLSPGEVYQQARQSMPGLTEPTVYRTLSFLSGQGLALAAHIGGGQLVYEYAAHNHHHLICRGCSQEHEIEHAVLEPLYAQFQESTGYCIDSMHVTFFGLCPECQETRR